MPDPAAKPGPVGATTPVTVGELSDLITKHATANGVPPELALAVAQAESSVGLNKKRVSPAGAIGIMQLMPNTAKDMGVDPNDPEANIVGGVKYLKLLHDHYGDDVTKILQAYNGGMGNIDKGIIPAESQAYAANITAALSAGQRAKAQPQVGKVGPATNPAARKSEQPMASHEGPGFWQQMGAALDPRTPEGRANLAGMTGGIVGGAAGSLTSPVMGPVGPVGGAIAGAGTFGALEHKYLEPWLTGRPAEGSTLAAGLEQGGQEALGQGLMWPVAKGARILAARPIAKAAVETLGEHSRAARAAGAATVRVAREQGRSALEAVKEAGADTVSRLKDFGRGEVARIRAEETGKVAAAKVRGAGLSRQVETQAAKTLERTGAEAAENVTRAGAQAAEDLGQKEADAALFTAQRAGDVDRAAPIPNRTATGEATREVFGGLPKLLDVPEGPIKKVLDEIGTRVEATAEDKAAPRVNIGKPKQKLQQMLGKAFPSNLSGAAQKDTPGIGYLKNIGKNIRSAAATVGEAPSERAQAVIAQQRAAIAEALGVQESHPITGVLADLMNAPDDISFAEAHILKKRFYEAINFDQTAKGALEGIRKATGVGLRDAMRTAGEDGAGWAPYEAANAEFRNLANLHRKGVGQRLVNLAASSPSKVASLVSPDSPIETKLVRDLLLTGADKDAKGAGQRAWDGIRDIVTDKHLTKQGANGLTQRIAELEKRSPEFIDHVYGDDTGKQILSNLKQLGAAYDQEVARQAAEVEATKAAGTTAVKAAKAAGPAAVEAAKAQGQQATEVAAAGSAGQIAAAKSARQSAVNESIRQSNRNVGKAGKVARAANEAQRKTNANEMSKALEASAAGKEAVAADAREFTGSSIHKFAKGDLIEQEAADLLRAGALGPGTAWGAMAIVRLLGRDANMSEMARWATYSGRNIGWVTKILNHQVSDRTAALIIREMMAAANPPAASHEAAIQRSKAHAQQAEPATAR